MLSTNADEAGAPNHVCTVVARLRERVEFRVVFGEEGPVAQRLRDLKVPVRVVPQMRSAISLVRDAAALRALRREVRDFAPDLIHAHSSKAGMLARMLAVRHGIPCIYTVHGWGWRGLGRVAGRLVLAIERLLSFAPRCRYVYVSRSVAREGAERLRLGAHRGVVIYNGVEDVGCHPEPPGPMTILMAARVTTAKDHESLVRAFERLDFDSELVLCGAGTETEAFRACVRAWAPRRHARVRCLGPRSDVPQLLSACHVFALISHFEALPLSIIEAMSAGRVAVASDVGGVRELIRDGEHGCIVGRGDVGAIAGSLSRLRDAALRARLGEAARRRYETDFTSERMSRDLLKAYESASLTRR